MTRLLTLLVTGSLLMGGLFGCGSSAVAEPVTEYDDLQPVTGQITFNGAPIPDATIWLHPVSTAAEQSLLQPPHGVVNENGEFEIYVYREEGRGRGAPVGEYRLAVSWLGPLEGLTRSQQDELEERLPARYTKPDRSGVTVTVTEGENAIPLISLK